MSSVLLIPTRLLARAEAALLGCQNPAELPKKAVRYCAALERFHAAAAYVRNAELELDDQVPQVAAVLEITLGQMSVDELDQARELFQRQLQEPEFQVLRDMLATVEKRAAERQLTTPTAIEPAGGAPVSGLERNLANSTSLTPTKKSGRKPKRARRSRAA